MSETASIPRRRAKQPSKLSCSPISLFGIGLIIAQLVIFNIGVSFFQDDDTQLQQQQHQGLSVHSINNRRSTRTRTTRKKTPPDPNADGTFNGHPIYYREKEDMYSLSHCVGENYQSEKSFMHRSCRFSFLCFDTQEKEFVAFRSPNESKLHKHLDRRPFLDVSQSYMTLGSNHSNTVSLGGINVKWGWKADGIPRLEWFPKIKTSSPEEPLSFYELPPQVVMVPFHSTNGANPGHLVWDDFLPIYTLLTMFQLEEKSELLMMRYVLKGGRGLWASCDWTDEKTAGCEKMHKKFLPLMTGSNPIHDLTTTETFNFQPKNAPKSNLVCARHGLAGIGSLTDHGVDKTHGWEDADYQTTHNHGRGGLLYDFRNYMMSNIGVPLEYHHKPKFKIVFSEKSSDVASRHIDFSSQIDLLRKSFHPKYVSIESYVFKDLSLVEQIEIVSQATIFITGAGGGAVTATFLPKGASVFLYYLETGGVVNNKATGTAARLDWDLFNNLAYLKVHWLPKQTMQTEPDLRALGLLVQHELDAHVRKNNDYNFF
jgi:hypothetical protein